MKKQQASGLTIDNKFLIFREKVEYLENQIPAGTAAILISVDFMNLITK
jgi:hypothetical protein